MNQAPIAPTELATMEPGSLATWLINRARDARAMLLSEDYVGLKNLLNTLSVASGFATGAQRDLLEVAEAFVKPLGASHLGRREIAVRTFLREQSVQGETFLATLLEKGGIAKTAFERFPDGLLEGTRPLFEAGVLVQIESRCVLSSGATGIVKDLLEPPALRFWAAVERARLAAQRRPPLEAAQIVAAQTGVLTDEAARFLRAHPLAAKAPRRHSTLGDRVAPIEVAGQGSPHSQDEAAISLDDDAVNAQDAVDVRVIPSTKRPRLDH